MKASNNQDYISRLIECFHLHWNQDNQLNDHDHNLAMEYYLKPNQKLYSNLRIKAGLFTKNEWLMNTLLMQDFYHWQVAQAQNQSEVVLLSNFEKY